MKIHEKMIPYPHSRYILISANQFLISSYYGYLQNEILISSMILMVYLTSLMLWIVPKEGFREKLDKTAVVTVGSYFIYKIDFDEIVLLGVFLMILSYNISSIYYTKMDYERSAVIHVIGVHTLGNIINLYIIHKLHFLYNSN